MVAVSIAKQQSLSQDTLRERLAYDSETGVFTHIYNRGHARRGEQAGTVSKFTGYRLIYVKCLEYQAHRLAWLYHYGEWPALSVDHVDGDKDNNRISNLRLATNQENQRNINGLQKNNTSGVRGVQWNKRQNKWLAVISEGGKMFVVGRAITLDEAAKMRRAAELRHFGEYAPGMG